MYPTEWAINQPTLIQMLFGVVNLFGTCSENGTFPKLFILNYRCGGFSYNMETGQCVIIGVPSRYRFIPKEAVTNVESTSDVYFHKVGVQLFISR